MPASSAPSPPLQPTELAPDLVAVRAQLRAGEIHLTEVIERCIAVASRRACDQVFLQTLFDEVRSNSAQANLDSPLAGLPVSVKDLFDMQGWPNRAASKVLAEARPAEQDAAAVARLRGAGGAVLGRTNMVEFAYAGVGLNPHFGTPHNAADPLTPRIPGGSSSGAAVSVATGAVFVGLGSDTGGSIRIPAALNGIVGFKPTARLVPTAGALPLSTTLDTACAMTRSVRDAIVAHEVLAATEVRRTSRPLSACRFAWTADTFLDGADTTVSRAFAHAVDRLRAAGATVEEIDMPELADIARLQAGGGLTAAESYAWHRPLMATHRDCYDPRVISRIERGAGISAADYIDLLLARKAWAGRITERLAGFDAVLSPTVPVVAPPIASVLQDDEAYFRLNALLLRNTTVVNLLDGCAVSLPCQQPGELPVGLMLWHAALHDEAILNIALAVEAAMPTFHRAQI